METSYPQFALKTETATTEEPRLTQAELFRFSEFYPEQLEPYQTPTQKAPRFDIKSWWHH